MTFRLWLKLFERVSVFTSECRKRHVRLKSGHLMLLLDLSARILTGHQIET